MSSLAKMPPVTPNGILVNSSVATQNGSSRYTNVRSSVVFDDPLRLLRELRQDGCKKDPPSHRPSNSSSCATALGNLRLGSESASLSETIFVAIRIRPRLPRDARQPDTVQVTSDRRSITITEPSSTVRGQKASGARTYDHIFDSRLEAPQLATQEHVYSILGDRLVEGALAGYNGCLFAYGQTGTGKTHTVVGHMSCPEQRGLLPRILEGICGALEKSSQDFHSRALKISFIEIYNEMVRDLLLPPPKREQAPSLSIRYTPQVGLIIDGLSEAMVATLAEARELVDFGMKMRSIASTSMNHRSSRSHTIFTFRLEQSHENGVTKMAQVQIVDLAGREQQRTSGDDPARLRERSFINKSLFHLSTCIGSLSKNTGGRLPEWAFRNSKLTLVLMNSLGKNSRTAMVAAVSPGAQDVDETISTLRFASAVKLIKTEASCNAVDKKDLIKELQQEIERLKMQQTDATTDHALQQRVVELEALCDQYRENLEEARVQAKALAAKRKEALEDLGLSVSTDNTSVSFVAERLPYLVNLSDDPFIEGSLMYFLKSTQTTVGTADGNTMKIAGLGVAPYHCQINRHDSEGLTIHVVHSSGDCITDAHHLNGRRGAITSAFAGPPRTLVNGQLVESNMKLCHQDHVVIGHACAFRVMVPYEERACDDGDGTSSSESESEVDTQLANRKRTVGSFGARLAERYCQHADSSERNRFAKEANEAMGLVDEANFITSQVCIDRGYQFELRVLAHCSAGPSRNPDLGVSMVARCKADVGGAVDVVNCIDHSICYIWSLPKFRTRVCAMQEIWEESQETSVREVVCRLEREPHLDPWREISEEEVQSLLHGTQVGLAQSKSITLDSKDDGARQTRKRGSAASTCDTDSDGDSCTNSHESWAISSGDDANEFAENSCIGEQNKWYKLGRRCSAGAIDLDLGTIRSPKHPTLLENLSVSKQFRNNGVSAKPAATGCAQDNLARSARNRDHHLPHEFSKMPADIGTQQHELAKRLAEWKEDVGFMRTVVSNQLCLQHCDYEARRQAWSEQINRKQAVLNQLRQDVAQLAALER